MSDSVTSESLRAARTEAHLSQRELATRLGVRPLDVSQWELGRAPISISAQQLASAISQPAPPPAQPSIGLAMYQLESVEQDLSFLRRHVREVRATLESLREPRR